MKIFSRISAFLFIVTLLGFSNFVFAAPSLPIPADPLTNGFELVNVDSDEVKGNGDANNDVFGISSDGRYVIFNSAATNLVADDTNGVTDIFVRDMESGITLRVSVDSEGNEANNHSGDASISSDGRYVAFSSNASNLVVGDSNGLGDIFVYDRDTDTIERVSIDSEGLEGNSGSGQPALSADGRYVAFNSAASNLVADDTNISQDIFVYDRDTDTIERVSIDSEGLEGNSGSDQPALSADGRYVAFNSAASNLVADDTNISQDIFVYDRDTDTIERVSVDDEGAEGNNSSFHPSVSSDGSSVVFHSYASNLVAGDTNGIEDIFVRDLVNDITERVSIDDEGAEGNSDSYNPSISSDGNLIAFQSNATNLVADDTNGFEDIFVYDRENNTISRLTADDEGNQTNSNSYNPAISADGAYVLFGSNASNLVDGDTNDAQYDVFWVPLATEGVPYIITEVTPIPRTTTDRSPIYHFAIEGEGEAELFVGDGCGSSILATALGSEPDDQQIEFSDLEYGETYECIISVYSDAGYSNELVVGPFTVRRSTSSGSSASSTSFSRSTAPTANPTQTPSQAPKFTFTKNLKFLMNDIEVKELQKFLNTNGYPISTVGAGSVGFETTLFGAKTKAALIAFQKANNITPAVGYFGPITRGIINSMLK